MYDDNNLHHLPGRVLRTNFLKIIENKSFITKASERISQDEYYKQIAQSKFVLCPMGVGMDTYRVYETAYLGSTPIVVSSGLDTIHKKFGALIVDKWDDLTLELLESHEYIPPQDEIFHVEHYIKTF
jgi:hypothetical protein